MRYVDLTIQTILMLAALVLVIASAFNHDLLYFFALDQFFLGVWQIAGCVIYLTVDPDNNSYRKTHLWISFIYIMSLLSFSGYLNDLSKGVLLIYFIVPSWSLGIYYFYITIKTAFPRTGSGKFLPHLGF